MGAMFKGAIVAIATPFKKGKVDEEALRGLIEFQIKNGTDGIVPCGTTGESPVLTHKEHDRVIEITVAAVKKRVPVIAGTGSNSTDECIRLTRHAYEVGADGALIVAPYYNRPTQEGLYQHYKLIAENGPHPHHRVQHPQPDGCEHHPGYHGEALENQEHRRRERSRGISSADAGDDHRLRPEFLRSFGR